MKILRPINVMITFFVVVVAILISQKSKVHISVIALSSAAAALVTGAGNIINDIYDIETDKISHPQRVLVLKTLSLKEVWFEYIILTLIAILIVAYLSLQLLTIALLATVMLFLYSVYFKKIPLLGNIVIALLTGLAFIYGGITAGNPGTATIPAIFAFLINLIREVVKDIQDVEGDKQQSIITLPIKFGLSNTKKVILALILFTIMFTLYPFVSKLYNIEYFILVMVIVNPVFILCIKKLLNRKADEYSSMSNLLKVNMIFGLIAIYLGN